MSVKGKTIGWANQNERPPEAYLATGRNVAWSRRRKEPKTTCARSALILLKLQTFVVVSDLDIPHPPIVASGV